MIKFILNNTEITTSMAPGMVLLDYIRYERNLKGTKIGCREGDCGACTVLIGGVTNGVLKYSSATSCLTALGNIHHKHIVTVEGVNFDYEPNPIQQAMCDQAGTQCGFCTPGFIVSMAGFCLSDKQPTQQNAIAAVDGNICRCTGYKSIERALEQVTELIKDKTGDTVEYVTSKNILPSYFKNIKERLQLLATQTNGEANMQSINTRFLGGGTDLYVQQHDKMVYADIDFLTRKQQLKGITKHGDKCVIGGAATVTDLITSPVILAHFPKIAEVGKLISSTPIRNIATLAGNFVNGSPIGDFSIFFLALGAVLTLSDGENKSDVALEKFYKGYKTLDKQPNQFVESFWFTLPDKNTWFTFEKVSKRTHLDIASVNSAMSLTMDGNIVTHARISAGGVYAFPLYLAKTSAFLVGKELTEELVTEATELLQTEIAPISDARGTAEYKRLLLSQLIKAHFIKLFPLLEIDKLLA
ncbi:xanthine dehydrogenase small subunit [Mucilaginibacter gracilis]|uniref:Xanthine dehydrogenase small subunit n=1 Tax=Mucilaginibacter gracilis TaxID=423350 RepID=A0A495J618_9SPHI|nr:FAD binding domain-containing protein [Mucilaginibacter gracilis]RKR83439.1 xanthine dehydrogenase small subunit [Mucilaginibacter gracilis]